MAKYLPDYEGNGRNLICKDRKTIGILNIFEPKNKHKVSPEFMKEYIEAYFCLNVEIIDTNKLSIEKVKKKLCIVDEQK